MNQENLLWVIAILLGLIIVKLFFEKKKDGNASSADLINSIRIEMQNRLDKMNESINKGMVDSSKTLQQQFATSSNIIKEVTQKLTTLDETNKQVVGFAKQMRSLEDILKNPKQRGILGEYFLDSLLSNVLQPNQYKLQYRFKDGKIVDAVIFYKKNLIPIDAKFSLEKYNLMMKEQDKERRGSLEKEFKKDLKDRIDETSKYINPKEDTTNFAFMFIPAEGIYYNLLIYKTGTIAVNAQDLIEYAFGKHVIIVSPTSFYAYLETVLFGLKALKMEESVKDILKNVGQLDRHLNSFQDNYSRVGKNLQTTINTYNNSGREFRKIDKDILKLGQSETQRDVALIEESVVEDE